jgi:hypothetical protein
MVNRSLYGLALSASDRASSTPRAALRNFQGRQHSGRQDGSDQFAIVHFLFSAAPEDQRGSQRSAAERSLAAIG